MGEHQSRSLLMRASNEVFSIVCPTHIDCTCSDSVGRTASEADSWNTCGPRRSRPFQVGERLLMGAQDTGLPDIQWEVEQDASLRTTALRIRLDLVQVRHFELQSPLRLAVALLRPSSMPPLPFSVVSTLCGSP